MPYRKLQIVMILLPTLLIGGFEYFRHLVLIKYMSMQTGNLIITLLTFLLSIVFSFWIVRTIRRINLRLSDEQAKRAVYEERERLARELHDGIAQTLFFLNIKIKQGKIEDAKNAISEIDSQVRQAIFNLRLPQNSDTLSKRLQEWLSQWSQMSEIDVYEEINLPDDYFTAAEQVQLFGIVQEAFANIRKHAHARHAELKLTRLPQGGFELWIADDGCGIELSDNKREKYGLRMMQERAVQLGAAFDIRNRAEGGTELQLKAIGKEANE